MTAPHLGSQPPLVDLVKARRRAGGDRPAISASGMLWRAAASQVGTREDTPFARRSVSKNESSRRERTMRTVLCLLIAWLTTLVPVWVWADDASKAADRADGSPAVEAAPADPAPADPAQAAPPAAQSPAAATAETPDAAATPATEPVEGASPAKDASAQDSRLGQFLELPATIDDQVLSKLKAVSLDLQSKASASEASAVLVLQLSPGTSQFHHVLAVTRWLTSNALAGVTTVAWVPETVTGPNALVALACRDIILHPDAELGDLGRGHPLDPEDQRYALALAERRINPLLSTAIVRSMFDPAVQVWLIRVSIPGEPSVLRTVTREELETLRGTGMVIEQADVVKEAGTLGLYSGTMSRERGVLIRQTVATRPEVAALYRLPRESLREPTEEIDRKRVRLIRVEGVIDTVFESFLQRQVDRAIAEGARVLIIEIDSPGGELMASLNLSQHLADLNREQVKTVAYVPEMALSGAAIIALGCDEIYLHPNARMGDAGPIEVRLGGPFERAPEKILSVLRSALATLAEKKGRPVALCEAMADRQLKVFQATNRQTGQIWYLSEAELEAQAADWVRGPQVREANGELLLTVDGKRAHELLLAERPVADLEDLGTRLGFPPGFRPRTIEQTWVDALVFWLNTRAVTVLIFVLAVSFLYLELHFPSGLLGILSVVCFAVFFWSRFLGGTAGWLEVILFLLGSGCLALEIFVIPGFGVFGISGILLVLASLLMAGQTFNHLEPGANLYELTEGVGTIVAAGGAFAGLAALLARVLPRIPFLDGMILQPNTAAFDGPQLQPEEASSSSGSAALLGQQGESISFLRPAGKARFQGRVVDVVSEGPFIPEGTPLQVTRVEGLRIVVRAAPPTVG
jgi:membrane-bound serine protease (ClpP class)